MVLHIIIECLVSHAFAGAQVFHEATFYFASRHGGAIGKVVIVSSNLAKTEIKSANRHRCDVANRVDPSPYARLLLFSVFFLFSLFSRRS